MVAPREFYDKHAAEVGEWGWWLGGRGGQCVLKGKGKCPFSGGKAHHIENFDDNFISGK